MEMAYFTFSDQVSKYYFGSDLPLVLKINRIKFQQDRNKTADLYELQTNIINFIISYN